MANEMNADDFKAWLNHMGLSGRQAAIKLGCSEPSIKTYKEKGAPLTIALACSAITFGLPPWQNMKGDR